MLFRSELPPQPREIKPHPYGIEFGMLLRMLHDTRSQTLAGFLAGDFTRVSSAVAQEICRTARLSPDARPRNIHGEDAEALYKAIQTTKIMAPPSNCLSPIGEKAMLHGLYSQIKGDFYTAVTRPPSVYRGNPFVIEAGLAYGKGLEQAAVADAPAAPLAEGEERADDAELARVIRYANRVPLLYQQSACATFKAVLDTAWRNYGAAQSRGALPAGPMVIFVHMASVWVPFTSEAKEAIADYDEIRKEIKLALQEAGRRLGVFLRRRERAKSEFRRRNIFELYIEEIVDACGRLKGGKLSTDKLRTQLQKIAAKRTGGARTDEILGHDGGPEGLPHSIIVTPEGIAGEASGLPVAGEQSAGEPEAAQPEPDIPVPAPATKSASAATHEPLRKLVARHQPVATTKSGARPEPETNVKSRAGQRRAAKAKSRTAPPPPTAHGPGAAARESARGHARATAKPEPAPAKRTKR